jgi:cell division protein FtsI/penicillin-binding protein 2
MIVNDITGTKNQGDNIVTTLDIELQKAAYDALGSNRGAVIVMEPGTGKILAMVSKPDFDPNTLLGNWNDITVDGGDSVLYNRATQGLYPPGSTFKLVTMLEYHRENGKNTDAYSYFCDGIYELSGHSIRCMQSTAHGEQNMYESLAHSCNCSFINMGLSLDISRYADTAEGLMFNSKLPLELEYNKSSFSLSDTSDQWEIAQTSFGQGKTLVTPMHLALITNAIACEGKVMTPYFVDRIENCNKVTVKRFKPELYKTIMTPEETAVLSEGMGMVAKQAFAWLYGNSDYTLCAKSGSAQYGTLGYEHSLFVSYAPMETPEISVTVVVEGGITRNTSAAEVAKKIYDVYFKK